MTTTPEETELLPRDELARLAREYLTSLTARVSHPALSHDAHQHLLATGHLPGKACCAPALPAVKAA